jgi:hypothetical protein
MEHVAFGPAMDMDEGEGCEQRGAKRYSLLIRPAKLSCSQGEFVCVLRDVSRSGVSARLFHDLPNCTEFELELQSGQRYPMRRMWSRAPEAGFEFHRDVDVSKIIAEVGAHPKRGLRLALEFPIDITVSGVRSTALVENISQQGARIHCDQLLALDQSLVIEAPGLRHTRAKVRWRRDAQYGVVFDDTYSLRDFAQICARLQAPGLIAD